MWEPIWGSRCISLTFFREDAQLGIQYISSSITEEEAFLQNLPKNKKFSQEANESAVIWKFLQERLQLLLLHQKACKQYRQRIVKSKEFFSMLMDKVATVTEYSTEQFSTWNKA